MSVSSMDCSLAGFLPSGAIKMTSVDCRLANSRGQRRFERLGRSHSFSRLVNRQAVSSLLSHKSMDYKVQLCPTEDTSKLMLSNLASRDDSERSPVSNVSASVPVGDACKTYVQWLHKQFSICFASEFSYMILLPLRDCRYAKIEI